MLEAEKKIRIISWVKCSKYSLGDLQETLESSEEDREADANIKAQFLQELGLLEEEEVPMDDQNILFVVSGYIARSLGKRLACKDCLSILKDEKKPTPEVDIQVEDNEPTSEESLEKRRFLDQINRGGLCSPSDLLFMSTLQIWGIYQQILRNKKAHQILLQCSNPRAVFSSVVCEEMSFRNELLGLLEAQCESNHSFSELLPAVSRQLFNIMSKNLARQKNDELNREKRSRCGAREHSEVTRKVSKLTSKK